MSAFEPFDENDESIYGEDNFDTISTTISSVQKMGISDEATPRTSTLTPSVVAKEFQKKAFVSTSPTAKTTAFCETSCTPEPTKGKDASRMKMHIRTKIVGSDEVINTSMVSSIGTEDSNEELRDSERASMRGHFQGSSHSSDAITSTDSPHTEVYPGLLSNSGESDSVESPRIREEMFRKRLASSTSALPSPFGISRCLSDSCVDRVHHYSGNNYDNAYAQFKVSETEEYVRHGENSAILNKRSQFLNETYEIGSTGDCVKECVEQFIIKPTLNPDLYSIAPPPRVFYLYGMTGSGRLSTVLRTLNDASKEEQQIADLNILCVNAHEYNRSRRGFFYDIVERAKQLQPCVVYVRNCSCWFMPDARGINEFTSAINSRINMNTDKVWFMVAESVPIGKLLMKFKTLLNLNGAITYTPVPFQDSDRANFFDSYVSMFIPLPDSLSVEEANLLELSKRTFVTYSKYCTYKEMNDFMVTCCRSMQQRTPMVLHPQDIIDQLENLQRLDAFSEDSVRIMSSRSNVLKHYSLMGNSFNEFLESAEYKIKFSDSIIQKCSPIIIPSDMASFDRLRKVMDSMNSKPPMSFEQMESEVNHHNSFVGISTPMDETPVYREEYQIGDVGHDPENSDYHMDENQSVCFDNNTNLGEFACPSSPSSISNAFSSSAASGWGGGRKSFPTTSSRGQLRSSARRLPSSTSSSRSHSSSSLSSSYGSEGERLVKSSSYKRSSPVYSRSGRLGGSDIRQSSTHHSRTRSSNDLRASKSDRNISSKRSSDRSVRSRS